MSNLSIVEAGLPPGFRFHPRDDELICDYLSNKVSHPADTLLLLEQVDLNHCEPWDLPETACVGGKEWYFYSQRDRKYATGLRTNRATVSGYWKATGKDRSILSNRTLVGMRKTLVFYLGRAPKGKKTDWVMHEFRLQGPLAPPLDSSVKEDWVLCRVFCKNIEIAAGVNVGSISSRYGGRHEDMSCTVSCSSSLPPLMDPYTLSFDQSQRPPNIFNEQVPCFSNTPSNPQFDLHLQQLFSNTSTIPPAPNDQPAAAASSSSSHDCCEKKEVIKTILSRFNKQQEVDNHTNLKEWMLSFGDGISDQSFLWDEEALPAVTMWYP